MMKLGYFLGEVFFMSMAHFLRAFRWELFIDVYEKTDRKNLIRSISIGYLLNHIVPFKLGDLARVWFSGRKMKNGIPLSLSTVIVDRYLDIICIGSIFAIFSIAKIDIVATQESASFYFTLALAMLFFAVAVYIFKGFVKKATKSIASIFNAKIETVILHFAWSLIWNFKDIFEKINKIKLIITTVAMWLGYLTSYFMFASFLKILRTDTSWVDIFITLFTQEGIKGCTYFTLKTVGEQPIFAVYYTVIPLTILLSVSYFIRDDRTNPKLSKKHLNLLPHLDNQERLSFLEKYFADSSREYIKKYLDINQDITIVTDYSAGSNATTMLCTDGNHAFFRKYAFGIDGEKLYKQILWINENKDKLVLPEILKKEKNADYCYYDMPYISNSVGLFEYAHSMPLDSVWNIIKKVLESLEQSIYKQKRRPSDSDTIHKYIASKVSTNIKKIKNATIIKDLLQYDTLIINGVEYKNLEFYERYLSEDYLKKVFENDAYAVIHGDLTIENIICTRGNNGCDDFYIIDPNTGNVHESPNLDYGKLLQSIHGGYEFLMSTEEVNVSGNKINFLFTKSLTYTQLHNMLRNYMKAHFGEEGTRSIYFHEIVHWLRLMPYKIEKIGKRALIFYAGMLMVMNDVIEMYGDLEV